MPQETNLNISPYFDDFDLRKEYYKVLFKPGYPVQARELTTLQSILKNQIEQFGNHVFKEGSVVIPGNLVYKNDLSAVKLESLFQGLSSERYLPYLINKKIKGQVSGVTATIRSYISSSSSVLQTTTLYVKYLNSDSTNNNQSTFIDGENLLLDETVSLSEDFGGIGITLQQGEGIATTLSQDSTTVGSAVFLDEGVYFLRGYFINVNKDILYLDQYSNSPSYKVGFRIYEQFINSYDDSSLNDNSQGFSNYAAPGADRFKIFAQLEKIPLDSTDVQNFVQLLEINNGILVSITNTPQYNILSQEFARRTYDESGDYYVKSPNIVTKESLNDLKGNEGVFFEGQTTYNNNVPSDDLGTYTISPLKAYVRGFEVETISPTYLDFQKPRTTKTLEDQSINYFTGPTYTVNRVYGSPIVGIATTYLVSLRDSRVGSSQTTASGLEIGLARVYDFALESGSYNTSNSNQNEWDIALYDIQTYTIVDLNEPITLSVPTHIKGKSSGAVGYLRYDASNSASLTVYNTKGKFSLGEKLIFDGIENTRVTTKIRSYGTGDVKSLYGIVGTSYTFTADTKQTPLFSVGQVSITASSGGISTVTSSDFIFVGVASTGNIVAFSNPGLSTNTFAKVETVSINSLTISGVTTVLGICDGSLPTSTINPSDFKILVTNLQSSSDNTLYTPLSKTNVSSVDFTNSNLTIRKQFDVTISSNSTGAILAGSNETFLPFDEERYVLIREDGTTEALSSDKLVFTNGSRTLTINGLGSNNNAKLIATLRKINIKSKIKNRNKIKTLIVNKSKYAASGVGATTLNDGLLFGNYPYGTRVQDEEICLLEPDVTKIYGIYESNDTNDPDLPSLILSNLSGPTNKTGDLLVGEEFVGKISQAVGLYSEKINDSKISFNYLNSNTFIEGEEVTFKESGITASITIVDQGDKNIISAFTLDAGQRSTIYDQSRIIRNNTSKEPTKKIKIAFESASFSASDTGDITTVNSYEQFDYCDIGEIDGISNSDILDIRPRVSVPSVIEGSRSPFEFLSRNITQSGNSASNVLASDESILLSYSFYLPRIDKIFLTKSGTFQLNTGVPSEIPQAPSSTDDALELATVSLPAYLCNINDVSISLTQHKRYQMSDISKLEDRIKNLEFYTSLSLLETDTSSLLIRDSNGLSRFKCGFFVDDFSTTQSQKKITVVKNSIDIQNSELRPTHHSTSVDLLLGSNSVIGIGTTVNTLIDTRTDTSLVGSGVKRTGQVVTLDYEEVAVITQPYSTRVVNVTPYVSDYFGGTIQLFPSSDVWIDQVRVQPKTINAEGNYSQTQSQLTAQGFDPQSGFGPVIWGSWETNWTGSSVSKSTRDVTRGNQIIREQLQSTTKTGTSIRQGTRQVIKEEFSTTTSDQIVNSQISPFVRSRNIEFSSKRMKPFTRLYAFFDGIDVNKFIIPKLLEISMTSGVFQVGETVVGSFDTQSAFTPKITFRVAQQNHKYGSYNNPTITYFNNPYSQDNTLSEFYSATSTVLNIDTYSLSNQPQGQFSGYVALNMKLRGQTSGAEATITDVKLITDNIGVVIGSYYIPNGNIDVNPSFQSGTKLYRLTSSSVNSQVIGATTTSAEEKYFSEGKIDSVQENIIVTRNARIETQTTTENKTVSDAGGPVVVNSTVVGTIPQPEPTRPSPPDPTPPKRYEGIAFGYIPSTGKYGIGDQNKGGPQSQAYAGGTRATIGAAGVERALADGYSLSSVQDWINRTNAAVGDLAKQKFGLTGR